MRRRSTSYGALVLRLRAWAAALTRVALVLIALHAGRVTHAVSDVWIAFDMVSAVALSDCNAGSSDDDDDCPPGCPNCHCVHCGFSSLPAREATSFAPVTPRDATLGGVPYEAHAPRAPALDSPFRPPRPTTLA